MIFLIIKGYMWQLKTIKDKHTKMNDILSLLPALLAGAILGIIFFGGLWLTIQKGLRSQKSALIFAGSFVIRMAITLLGFYYVGENSWQKLLVCLAGFIITRTVITRITQKNNYSKVVVNKGGNQ